MNNMALLCLLLNGQDTFVDQPCPVSTTLSGDFDGDDLKERRPNEDGCENNKVR